MFRNYFKTAFRTLLRNRIYTFINIAGLTLGISVCLVLFITIRFHESYDNFHAKKDRIYRVLTEYHHSDAANIFYGKGVPKPMPAAIAANFPQVEKSSVLFFQSDQQIIVMDENGHSVKKFREENGVYYTVPGLFEIFDLPWIAGSPSSLNEPNNVALTKETAEKYFGDWHQAMGKSIKLNNTDILKVSGILATIPGNTDLQLKVVISYGTGYTANFKKSTDWDGTGSSFGCFILLSPGTSPEAFNLQLREFSKKMESADNKDSHIVQPLSKVHFDTQIGDFSNKTISPELVKALRLIGIFILLIACVNFINLSTAQAVNRAREVGVRKVLGSSLIQLRGQFITETFILVFASVIFAIGVTFLAIPAVAKILQLPLFFRTADPEIWLFLLTITVLVTFLAGFYPSIVLSGFNPINALKSKISAGKTKGLSLRRILVTFQFIIALVLIIGTLVIVKQMNYFTNQPLGFDKEAIVNIPIPEDSAGNSKIEYLKKQLRELKDVKTVSFSSNTPVEDNNDNWTNFNFDHAIRETDFYAINKWTDNNYLGTYQLPLVAGRNINPSDTVREFLVNESLVKKLGITDPNKILNKEISLWGNRFSGPVVGVLKDFHNRSFRAPFAPLLISTFKGQYNNAGIKLSAQNLTLSIQRLETVWNHVFPDYVFNYEFLDAKIENFYKQENQLSQLYKIFAFIAIFLSCLGLYGLASFMATQRLKEVGIRKVLGASAKSIVFLFSKEFMALIGIAFIVASPIAWYFMHKWLEDFVYRIDLSWWIFVIGGMLALMIALMTVSFQAIKAAVTSPIRSLRNE